MARSGSYVFNLFPDMFGLVDEGGYFCAHNNQTGIATAATVTAFSATNPFLTIFNKDGLGGRKIYMDFLTLIATAAGTAGTSLQCAVVVDTGNRYTSGGTALTGNITNPYYDQSSTSVAVINAGNITAAAASSTVRVVTGNRWLKTAIPAGGDSYTVKFGGVESMTSSGPTAAVAFTTINVPKIVVGPQETGLVYIWLPSQSGASSYIPELGWVER